MAIDAVTAIASGTDDAIKLVLQKDAQANTPAEIAAKQAQQVQDLKDAINAAILKGDLDEVRRLCA
jgi:hypothetical protein